MENEVRVRRPTSARRVLERVLGLSVVFVLGGCQDVSVRAVPVASLEVSPATVTLTVGESAEFDAVARDERGTRLPGRPVGWSVDDADVARIDADGVLEGVGSGTTRVVARSDGVTGTGEVTVLPRPSIELSPTRVAFEALEGQDDPPPDTVSIRNVGGGTLSGLDHAISYPAGQPTGWLTARVTSSTAPADLVLRAGIEGLPEGTYEASVDVRSPEADNSPREVAVTLSVGEAPPRIDLSSTEVAFTATKGATEPAEQMLSVSNGGGGTLTSLEVTGITYDANQRGGWLAAELEDSSAPTTLLLQALARNLPPGEYGATVTVSDPDAVNAPVSITVSFTVTS